MFRHMSEEMGKQDVEICMMLLFEGSRIIDIYRDIKMNFLEVEFVIDGRSEEFHVSLLPDGIEDLSAGLTVAPNRLYEYRQFMVAKRYSELWKDNIFSVFWGRKENKGACSSYFIRETGNLLAFINFAWYNTHRLGGIKVYAR